MNESVHPSYRQAVRITEVVCGLLFSAFSFVWLFFFQRYVLEAVHFTLSEGRTHFAPLATSLVLTALLVLLRCAANAVLKLRGDLRSLSYFPSFMVLCAFTSVGRGIYVHGYHTPWLWLLPVLILVFMGVVCGLRLLFRPCRQAEGRSVMKSVNANLAILLLLCLTTVCVSNTDRAFHHELEVEHHLRYRDYGRALQVGERSTEAGRTLTALRALALSHSGQMGESLFNYPQYEGAEGLFFDDDSLRTLRYTNDSVYWHIGVRPYRGESHLHLLRDACYKGTGKHTSLDYYMAALLLDKRLDDFVTALGDFYTPGDSLPRHYREALLLCRDRHPGYTFGEASDTLMAARYAEYCGRKAGIADPVERDNRMRRDFGNTYWWYFDHDFSDRY